MPLKSPPNMAAVGTEYVDCEFWRWTLPFIVRHEKQPVSPVENLGNPDRPVDFETVVVPFEWRFDGWVAVKAYGTASNWSLRMNSKSEPW